ncbi:RagB/SusD family nutrient uptake outer membrane protein [Chitinophaga sp. sic0106]|uniref:RagB/SusD family nutrient uptake outer membrane protein n=1 Tax=Chitinophaga sp. sic0106 TaxID=2854785 RepID=UPI001C46924B|nr:RagB/SusD family nutrient uptake outer membrane protein [Chitinophaga sp. sic0106]MBV7533259.1 RagB/SusD family nutrient uptake outer membrane protein [Chitinophaga sp. sic0106]
MKKYISILLLAGCIQLGSCSSYLDVKPEDKYLEDQVFNSETTINLAVNGVYLSIADNNLYGANLSTTTVEVLAQRYNIAASGSTFSQYNAYAYNDATVQGGFDAIWTNAYASILNINKFLNKLENSRQVIPAGKADILKGEMLGLRACLHFDLLRLFGPIYNTSDSTAPSIPFRSLPTADLQSILPANQVMDSILTDLNKAESLLAGDPVRTAGMMNNLLNDGTDFYRIRNRRMNFYAVKSLQARVQLYRGSKAAALTAANQVISEGETWLPWLNYKRITSDQANPDRIFSPEIIFGAECSQMYNNQLKFFAGTVTDASILAPYATRLSDNFENNENDYRYVYVWILPSDGGKNYRTFFKYADIQSKDSLYRFLQPLIRKTELYYIIAECETDPVRALTALNTVRYNRGITDLPATANIATEIQKEYVKEFYGEGQLFFFYKRRNLPSIPRGSAPTGVISMNKATYVVPLPLSETSMR